MTKKYEKKRLEHLSKFVEHRGGWKGLTKSSIKGLLSSLPFVGKTIEEVVYSARDVKTEKKVNEIIERCENQLQCTDNDLDAMKHLLILTDNLLSQGKIKDSERNEMIMSSLADIGKVNQKIYEEIKFFSESSEAHLSDIKTILGPYYLSKDKLDNFATKAAAVFTLEEINSQIRELWPPKPFLSASIKNGKEIGEINRKIKTLIDQGTILILMTWRHDEVQYITDDLYSRIQKALDSHFRAQESWVKDDMLSMLNELKGTPANRDALLVIDEWCKIVELIAAIFKRHFIDVLKTHAQDN